MYDFEGGAEFRTKDTLQNRRNARITSSLLSIGALSLSLSRRWQAEGTESGCRPTAASHASKATMYCFRVLAISCIAGELRPYFLQKPA